MAQLKTETNKVLTKIFLVFVLLSLASVSYDTKQAQATSPKIAISITPPIINADGQTHEIITIELRSQTDQPYIALTDIPIRLSSSNLDIGTIQTSVTIEKGSTFTKAKFTAKKNSGMSIITATSSGFQTGQGYIQVLRSNFDANLELFASPNSMPAITGKEGVVTVQILDSTGTPFKAIDDIPIIITSSNHSICTVTKEVTIPRGENYVTTNFRISGTKPGQSLLSAQAQGFGPGNDVVNTFNITGGPTALSIFFGPESVVADQAEHSLVHIQLQDEYGNPQKAQSTMTVYLSSSNTNIASIEDTITINSGYYSGVAKLTTHNINGESIIAAQSPGLYPDYETIFIKGQVPTLLGLDIKPNTLISDGASTEILTIQILDNEGNPVEAREDINIFLSSSNSDVGVVPESITIEAGQSYATAPFISQGGSGDTTIIASSMGIAPKEAVLSAIILEMNATLVTPITLKINQTFYAEVQIVSNGQPVPDAIVEWTALGGVILSQDETTNQDGISQAQIIQKYDQLRLKASVSKTGFVPVEETKNIQITQDIEQTELTVNILGRTFKVFHVLIALAVIIAIAMGAYVYIKYRRTKDDEPEDLEIYT